ncbi:MAG: methyltransferase domain-containing protein [Bdellovibrionaceae bacterium]|nr:methyltransferase domain-containing protein [Pseudobdellovibrionaceae bacterium]
MTGVDPSPTMLAKARATTQGVTYVESSFEAFPEDQVYDLILSNAAIQWMPDHRAVFAKLRRLLAPGGALLVQMPHNYGEPSHRLAMEEIAGFPEVDAREAHAVEPLTHYAQILFDLGFGDIDVREKVYLHPMARATQVADWTRGTFLTEFEKQMTPERFQDFVARYEKRLTAHYGPGPCLFLFRRFLLGARLDPA